MRRRTVRSRPRSAYLCAALRPCERLCGLGQRLVGINPWWGPRLDSLSPTC
jgi:hypothetical protein